MKNVLKVLDSLNIKYEIHHHHAVFTVEDTEKYKVEIDAIQSKNLFLRGKKDSFYLVVVEGDKKVDLKKLATILGEPRLSFASPEKLLQFLKLTPGSVSPFGLINDTDRIVHVIVDNKLMDHPLQGFHPNINTATVVLKTEDFKKYLSSTENKIQYLNI